MSLRTFISLQDWWPCPIAGEGHDACPKRFWSDAESRRRPLVRFRAVLAGARAYSGALGQPDDEVRKVQLAENGAGFARI